MRIPTNQYKSILSFAQKELTEIYPPEEIQSLVFLLFEDISELKKVDIILNLQKGVSESELLKYNFAIKDLKRGKPIQHILGYGWFDGLKFDVSPSTLIPRPETEELVQMLFEAENKFNNLEIIDLGTGTGCIPISLKKRMPQHHFTAVDFSDEILKLAGKNALKHETPISIRLCDLLSPSTDFAGLWDVIISNPPYVLESDKSAMHPNVLNHEPSSALFVPDDNPLLFYKSILKFAGKHLNKGGRLYFEIHEKQGKNLLNLLIENHYNPFPVVADIFGKDRFVKAIKPF